MKKIFLSIVSIATVMVACKPVEVRDVNVGNITDADLQKMSSVTVVQENGQNVNMVLCQTSAPVTAVWGNGITRTTGNYAEVLMFATGEQEITIEGLCFDGSIVKASYKVNIDKMSDKYPVSPYWDYLTGGSSKDWTWHETKAWGNGQYNPFVAGEGAAGGEWWICTADDVTGQVAGYNYPTKDGKGAKMTFTLVGTKLTKSNGGEGTFSFDEKTTTGLGGLAIKGIFNTTGDGVLFNCPNDDGAGGRTHSFHIVNITENELCLCEPTGGEWDKITWWRYVPAN